jgi:hypothetical protein
VLPVAATFDCEPATAFFGDQLVIEYDFFAAPATPPPPERLDM